MQGFEQGDVVRVPYPYGDRFTGQRRPGLVISAGGIGRDDMMVWIAMITSIKLQPWPGDVELGDGYVEAGLPFPSVIRPSKIATIDARLAERLGRIAPDRLSAVLGEIARNLRLWPDYSQMLTVHE